MKNIFPSPLLKGKFNSTFRMLLLSIVLIGVSSFAFFALRKENIEKYSVNKASEWQNAVSDSISAEIFQMLHTDPSKARQHAQESIGPAAEAGDNYLEIELLKHIGSSYVLEGNFAEGLSYYSDALYKAKEYDIAELIADINNNIGVVNRRIGNLKNALAHFTEALTYDEYLGNNTKKANTLGNIGLLYLSLENIEKAKSYSREALEVFTLANDTIGIASALNNMSLIFSSYQEYDNALDYLNEAIRLSEIIDNQYNLCISYQSLGKIYLKLEKAQKAISSFEKSREIAEKINQVSQYAGAQLGIAQALLLTGNTDEAFLITNDAMRLATELNSLNLKMEAHMAFSSIHKQSGEFQKSLQHYAEYVSTKELLLSEAVIHQLYDFELNNLSQANKLQQVELESKELAISKKNNLLLFTILIFLLTIAGLYLIYLNHRNRQRVKLQETIIRLTENKSHATVEAEIQERKRIGQELHDGLGQMLSVAGLHISVLQKKRDISEERRIEMLDMVMKSVDEAFTEVRNISHNLAPSLLSERGLAGALKSLSDQVNQTRQLTMNFETFGLEGKLNSLVENTLFRAIQEILSNTIKHSQARSLSFQIAQGSHEITLMAEDDGKGFDVDKIKPDPGNGLIHMKTRIENLNGSIHIDSNPGRGTIVSIVIPLNPTNNVNRTHQSISGR